MIAIPKHDPLRADRGHRGYVRGVAVVTEHTLGAVTVGYDGTLRKFRLPSLAPCGVAHAHDLGGGAIAAGGRDGLVVTVGADGRVAIWDAASDSPVLRGEVRLPIDDENPIVECVAFAPDGGSVFAGAVGGSLWRVGLDGAAELVDDGLVSINSLRFSPSGDRLLVASDLCTVRVYERRDRRWTLARETVALDDHVDAIAILRRRDGFSVVATTHGPRVWVFDDVEHGRSPRSAAVAASALNACVVVDGTAFVAGDDRRIYAVDPATLAAHVVATLPRDVDALVPAPGDALLAATTAGLYLVALDGRGILAEAQDRGALAAVVTSGGLVYAGQHDAPRIAVGRFHGERGETVATLDVAAPVSCGAANAPVFGLADGSIVRVNDGRVARVATARGEVEGACVARDGAGREVLVAVDRTGAATCIRGTETVTVQVAPIGSRLKAATAACLDGEPHVLAAGKDHALYALVLPASEAPRARRVHSPTGAARTFNGIAVDPDAVVYLTCWDGRVHRIRLGARPEELTPLEGHRHAVEGVLWRAGRLVTTSYDGTCRIWVRCDAGLQVRPPLTLSALAVRRLAPGDDERTVLAAGYDGNVVAIDVVSERVVGAWRVAL